MLNSKVILYPRRENKIHQSWKTKVNMLEYKTDTYTSETSSR